MIKIELLDPQPIQPGDRREIVLSGDGPFTIVNRCFVDAPPPPGFRPCAACASVIVAAGESHFIVADERFWGEKKGRIDIAIKDSVGESLRLSMTVKSEDREPEAMITGYHSR